MIYSSKLWPYNGSHSLMLACISVREDVLQRLSAELYVTLLVTDPLKLLVFRGLIGYMQIRGNFKGSVKGLKCIKEPEVWKWEYTHTYSNTRHKQLYLSLSPSHIHTYRIKGIILSFFLTIISYSMKTHKSTMNLFVQSQSHMPP